jgi:hypothetical protein
MLCLIDEFTREAMAIRIKRKLMSTDVLETLVDVMICRGTPDYIRSDNVLYAEALGGDGPHVSVRQHGCRLGSRQ